MLERFTAAFPLWAILLSGLAFFNPATFTPFSSAIIPLLTLVMFGMGMTLTIDDFKHVFKQPRIIGLGVALQYLIMPPAAWLISRLFNLPVELMVGMVLVGSSAGGTASNVICYLAKGNVALSITLTLTSTLLAVFAMPALTWLYAGQSVPVPALAMLFSILKIVLIPVLLGVIVNSLFRQRLAKVVALFPFISSLAIIMIIAIIVALNNNTIATMGMVIMWAVILHNLTGLFAGYMIARKLGHDAVISRTLAIEVGMQNSGLSVALATKYFTASAALPGALFSVWHNISGSVLAAWWARQK